ncbi:beta-1,3-galactosyltransferase 6 [Frankliniella occidentalis]|uniref:Hexosyltransferase n=1 Tax=Frankliniella occidentalis TaxID=133901 RepID=A0A6J1TNB3_FRAOC|nr:beta-1,3-galactosyltransferase 6 [Frankliniella occidentalis]
MSMSTPLLISKTKPYRLGTRLFWYLLCFFIGCTFTVFFISSSDCLESDDQVYLMKKDQSVSLKSSKKTLLIIILSAPDHVEKRHALRRTWLSLIDHDHAKYLFSIGTKSMSKNELNKLQIEHQHYSDLLILPEVEEDYNLLTKKLLVSLSWADSNFEFDFVLKVDDDSYVNIRNLMKELMQKADADKLYWGYFNGRAQVRQKGKWKETSWNLCDRYLPYARGGGYIISRQLVHYLAQNYLLLNLFKNEDVAVGAWLAPLNVTRVHDVRFDTEWASRGCSNQYLITHPQEISEIYNTHETLTNNGRLCKVEFEKRPAYDYDWSVLPSQCCNNLAH